MTELHSSDGLDPRQFPDLNRQFFTADRGPHTFVYHRLCGALLAATENPAVREALAEGIALGEMRLSLQAAMDDESREESRLFVALESTVLFHHAAEALLRLLIALKDKPPCPWLEVTALRQPGMFPKAVAKLRAGLSTREIENQLVQVFFGRSSRDEPPACLTEDRWYDAIDGLKILVAECAQRNSSESALYNSAKHGLTAVQGRAAVQLAHPGEDPWLTSPDQPSLTILENGKDQRTGARSWGQTTHWISAERTFALTFLIAQQIEGLWGVARARYVEPSEFGVHLVPASTVHKAIHGEIENEKGYEFHVPNFTLPLIRLSPADNRRAGARGVKNSKNRKRR